MSLNALDEFLNQQSGNTDKGEVEDAIRLVESLTDEQLESVMDLNGHASPPSKKRAKKTESGGVRMTGPDITKDFDPDYEDDDPLAGDEDDDEEAEEEDLLPEVEEEEEEDEAGDEEDEDGVLDDPEPDLLEKLAREDEDEEDDDEGEEEVKADAQQEDIRAAFGRSRPKAKVVESDDDDAPVVAVVRPPPTKPKPKPSSAAEKKKTTTTPGSELETVDVLSMDRPRGADIREVVLKEATRRIMTRVGEYFCNFIVKSSSGSSKKFDRTALINDKKKIVTDAQPDAKSIAFFFVADQDQIRVISNCRRGTKGDNKEDFVRVQDGTPLDVSTLPDACINECSGLATPVYSKMTNEWMAVTRWAGLVRPWNLVVYRHTNTETGVQTDIAGIKMKLKNGRVVILILRNSSSTDLSSASKVLGYAFSGMIREYMPDQGKDVKLSRKLTLNIPRLLRCYGLKGQVSDGVGNHYYWLDPCFVSKPLPLTEGEAPRPVVTKRPREPSPAKSRDPSPAKKKPKTERKIVKTGSSVTVTTRVERKAAVDTEPKKAPVLSQPTPPTPTKPTPAKPTAPPAKPTAPPAKPTPAKPTASPASPAPPAPPAKPVPANPTEKAPAGFDPKLMANAQTFVAEVIKGYLRKTNPIDKLPTKSALALAAQRLVKISAQYRRAMSAGPSAVNEVIKRYKGAAPELNAAFVLLSIMEKPSAVSASVARMYLEEVEEYRRQQAQKEEDPLDALGEGGDDDDEVIEL